MSGWWKVRSSCQACDAEASGGQREEHLAVLVLDVHRGHRQRRFRESFRNPQGLEGAEGLPIEVHCTGSRPDLGVPFQADRGQPGLAQQRQRGHPDGPSPDHHHVDIECVRVMSTPSGSVRFVSNSVTHHLRKGPGPVATGVMPSTRS